jgi:hypothetical protein
MKLLDRIELTWLEWRSRKELKRIVNRYNKRAAKLIEQSNAIRGEVEAKFSQLSS